MKFGTGMRTSFDGGKEGKHRPGPNQYSADPSKIQRSAPNYGFGSQLRQSESHKRLYVPGPGQYMAKTFTGQEGSRFSMAQTIDYEPLRKESQSRPGPGNYDPNANTVLKKESQWVFGSEVRKDQKFEKAQTFQTAPGQYDPDINKVKYKAAGWRIGTQKQRPGLSSKDQAMTPGAGSYKLPSSTGIGPKIQMHAKLNKIDENVKKNVPGPGNYDL